jgi:hypothetical protein
MYFFCNVMVTLDLPCWTAVPIVLIAFTIAMQISNWFRKH